MVYVPAADPTAPREMYEGLNTSPIQCLGGFDLSTDDPANYTDKNQFVDHRREWPRKAYPPGADLDEDPLGRAAQFAGGSAGAGPSTSGASQAAPPAINPAMLEMRKNLEQYHHDLVRLCSKAGIPDVCANFKATRVENILKGLSSKDLHCKLCHKEYSNTTHLRNHILKKHLKKTNFHCERCKKYFTDKSTFKDHMRKHDPNAKRYTCTHEGCGKEFFSKSKLEAHMPKHSGERFWCAYCNDKSFVYKSGVQEHERKCPDNPNRVDRPTCRLCGKDFSVRRSLQRHMDKQHGGASIDK